MSFSDTPASRRLLWLGLASAGALAAFRLVRHFATPDFDYANRTVLLTGGSRGLGLVLARQLAAAGARLALVARDPAELEEARRELAATGATVRVYPADLTNEAAREQLVGRVEADLGPVEVLLHNAGVIQVSPLENLSAADYRQALQIHFEAPLHLLRRLVPGMRARGTGRVILIASLGGRVAVPHMAAYSASKFALVGLGEGWAAELAGSGVSVTTVCPGLIRTGSARQALVKGQHAKEYQWFKLAAGLPGLTIAAEEAAAAILKAGQRGQPVLVLPASARLLNTFRGVFPSATVRLMGLVSHYLPAAAPEGEASQSRKGAEVESGLTTNLLTTLTDQAAAHNNEV